MRWAPFVLFMLLGCDHPAVSQFEIHVRAVADGAPMAGVRVSEGGAVLGQSGDDGVVVLVTERPEGATVGLSLACPEGYRARPEQVTRTLRTWAPLDAERGGAPPLEIDVRCERRVSDLVIVVDGGRAGLPVSVDGAVVDRTDAVGLAHLLVRGTPGRRLLVSIDTSAIPKLLPENPERSFTITADDVVYWQQRFEMEGSQRRGRARRPTPTERDLPERIE